MIARLHLGSDVRPGWLAGGHLYDGACHRPDISCPAHPFLVDDFRRHPMWGSLDALLHLTIWDTQILSCSFHSLSAAMDKTSNVFCIFTMQPPTCQLRQTL